MSHYIRLPPNATMIIGGNLIGLKTFCFFITLFEHTGRVVNLLYAGHNIQVCFTVVSTKQIANDVARLSALRSGERMLSHSLASVRLLSFKVGVLPRN